MIQNFEYDVGRINDAVVHQQLLNSLGLENFLVQLWEANIFNKDGGSYLELTTYPDRSFITHGDEGDRMQLLRYRTYSASRVTRILGNEAGSQKPEGIISRVFRCKSPEISPNITYYSLHEYPDRDFALSCGIRASFCFPFFKTIDDSGRPDGLLEFVSSCNQDVEKVTKFCNSFEGRGLYLWGFPSRNIPKYAIPEMDRLLEVVCHTFQLPLAQYWITASLFPTLSVVQQFSYRAFENLTPWCQFRDACLQKTFSIGEGLVGNTYISRESFFCRDVTKLSITDYPLAHYARNCGSIACFTLCVCSFSPQYKQCILELFLPSQNMDSYYPQNLLNSLYATMKEDLPEYLLASGEDLGQVISVKVINSSTPYEPESFNIGQPDYLPHHEGSGCSRILNLFEDGTEQSGNLNSYEELELTDVSRKSELEDNVIKRLRLDRDGFSIKYQDSDGELILIGCDEDVQEYMKFSRSSKQTAVKLLIDLPVSHCAS